MSKTRKTRRIGTADTAVEKAALTRAMANLVEARWLTRTGADKEDIDLVIDDLRTTSKLMLLAYKELCEARILLAGVIQHHGPTVVSNAELDLACENAHVIITTDDDSSTFSVELPSHVTGMAVGSGLAN